MELAAPARVGDRCRRAEKKTLWTAPQQSPGDVCLLFSPKCQKCDEAVGQVKERTAGDGLCVCVCVCGGGGGVAIFSTSHPSAQIHRTNFTGKLAYPPPPTHCLRKNAELMNHEYILWLSLSDLSEPRIPSLGEDGAIYIYVTHTASFLLLFQATHSSVAWLNPRCQVWSRDLLFFEENGRKNPSPSDNGRTSQSWISPQMCTSLPSSLTSASSESSRLCEGVDESLASGLVAHLSQRVLFFSILIDHHLFPSCLLWTFYNHIFDAKH